MCKENRCIKFFFYIVWKSIGIDYMILIEDKWLWSYSKYVFDMIDGVEKVRFLGE